MGLLPEDEKMDAAGKNSQLPHMHPSYNFSKKETRKQKWCGLSEEILRASELSHSFAHKAN